MTKKRVEQYGVTQMFGKVLVPTDFSEYAKNHFIPHNDPGIQEVVLQHGVDAPSTPSTY
jgi:hypothetical protein